MHRETEAALTARVHKLIQTGSTDSAEEIYRLSVRKFVDLDYHQAELVELFYARPQAVAFSSEIRGPGRFVTRSSAAGLPLILVRDEQGRAHALVNVCRHWGARVVAASAGEAERFTCPFHAWCYGLDGTISAIPGADGFAGMAREERGLVTLPVEERHGLIWVRGREAKATPVRDWLGEELDDELSGFELDGYTLTHHQDFDIQANWKLTMDGFLESYHVRSLHRNSIGPYFYSNVNTVDQLGRHLRMVPASASTGCSSCRAASGHCWTTPPSAMSCCRER